MDWLHVGLSRGRAGQVSTATVSVGVLGVLGNKGAVAARFRHRAQTLCVVCAHLAAGDAPGNFERRCQDYADVSRHIVFAECAARGPTAAAAAAAAAPDAGPDAAPVAAGGTLFFSPPLSIDSHSKVGGPLRGVQQSC